MKDKILITGADGFIGSHLTELCLEKGYRVKALSYYNSFNHKGWLDGNDNKNLEIVVGDIRDPFFCFDIVKDVSVVYNLAALIAVPYSYIAPGSYIQTNIGGTYNICEAAKRNGNIRLVQVSSSEVYGTAQYIPIDEKHPKQSQSPYSASKIGADAIAISFYHSFGLPVIIARPFNTYGPRQSCRAVIPSIITQIVSGKKKVVLGDISTIRDFNFISDICEGILTLGECKDAIGREVNICSNTGRAIEEVLNHIKTILNADVTVEQDNQLIRPTKSEVLKLQGDSSLLYNLTGWQSKVTITDGLKTTCEWYKRPENLQKFAQSPNPV
jgi:NAD dependent epimerase/dehydratase